MQHLAWTVGVRIEELEALAEDMRQERGAHYKHSVRDMDKGKPRHIDNPAPRLKEIQRLIVRRVLAPLGFGDVAHGSIKGRSPETNAKVHQGQRCVVKMDVKSFFPSVHHTRVYRLLRHEHGFGRDVARLLTRLVTLRKGLPQGAPTSPAVANQLARGVDEELKLAAKRHQLKVSRYVDDITISGDQPKLLMDMTTRLLKAKGLTLAPHKTKVCPNSGPQEVTGLVVNHDGKLSIPRAYRDAVRSSIHKLRSLPRDGWPEAVASIKGKIKHIERYNKGSAVRLDRYLTEVTSDIQGWHIKGAA
jgi:RNA-directed DNA polymerase